MTGRVPGPTWGDHSFEADLTAPFPEKEVRWTVAASRNKNTPQHMDLWTPYLNADSIRDRLDAVAGAGGWSVDYEAVGEKAVICRLTIHGVTRADVGEPGDQARQPWKAAATDALKRAAVQFGIGRYLHKVKGEWRKPEASPPRPPTSQPATARPAVHPDQPAPAQVFNDLLAAHGVSTTRAASLLGAMTGATPHDAVLAYVAKLPGDDRAKWKKAADNLSAALAEETLR